MNPTDSQEQFVEEFNEFEVDNTTSIDDFIRQLEEKEKDLHINTAEMVVEIEEYDADSGASETVDFDKLFQSGNGNPAPAPVPAAPGVVYGRVGGGSGGRGDARLTNADGQTWKQEADPYGNYRFDGVPPGEYELVLGAESALAPCQDNVCIGTAVSFARELFVLHPGEVIRRDHEPYGPTAPAPPPTTTTTVTVDPGS